MPLKIGVARRTITPPWGVELAGLGYYLGRAWTRIRDDLTVTALVADGGPSAAAIIAIDLMYLDAHFTGLVREMVSAGTGIPPEAVMVSASHSHNAPTAARVPGVGEFDVDYVRMAARQAATAAICAWRARRAATLHFGATTLEGMTFNRTREAGPLDSTVSVLRADDADGRLFAIVLNYSAHPTTMMETGLTDVSRDYPGQTVDLLEAACPGAMAMFLQGACGDVMFRPEYGRPETCREPGRALAGRALEALARSQPVEDDTVSSTSHRARLPTRRYTREEVLGENEEGHYRLSTGDTAGWRDSIGSVMMNYPDRFPERYGGDVGLAVRALARFAVEWTEAILPDLDTRPEVLETEVQAIRLGDVCVVAQPSELFSSLALDLRRRSPVGRLMIAGYANDAIGYMPDEYDVARGSYAARQSPKFTGHFPFTAESGHGLVDEMGSTIKETLGCEHVCQESGLPSAHSPTLPEEGSGDKGI